MHALRAFALALARLLVEQNNPQNKSIRHKEEEGASRGVCPREKGEAGSTREAYRPAILVVPDPFLSQRLTLHVKQCNTAAPRGPGPYM